MSTKRITIIIKISKLLSVSIIGLCLLSKQALAAGGPNPYGHTPVPAGFETDIFYLSGIFLFISGLLILSTVKSIKSKINNLA